MKYSKSNPPLVCMQTQSTCYKGTSKLKKVKGILWHSTGANNKRISRYVQPSDDAPDKDYMISIIGKNPNNNDWNHIERFAGLNCWIGELADGTVSTVQTMPWDYAPWGCGEGPKGSCNDGWIQFEICEDSLADADYFEKVYKEACEITAYLCEMFNINPEGYVDHNGVNVPTILCHADSNKLGLGSAHGDVNHWFPKFGKSMATVRKDVAAIMAGEEEVTQEQFNKMMDTYLLELAKKAPSDWSQDARLFAESKGLIKGDESGKMYKKFVTREEMIEVLYRMISYGL